MTENTRQNENGQKNTQCTKNLKKEKKKKLSTTNPTRKRRVKEEFEDTKGLTTRIRKSKDRQHNGQDKNLSCTLHIVCFYQIRMLC